MRTFLLFFFFLFEIFGADFFLRGYMCFISPLIRRPVHMNRTFPCLPDWPIRLQQNCPQQN